MTELELFEAALERSPTDRAPFLDEACAGNQPLHQRLEALLARPKEADASVRFQTATALGRIGDPTAVPGLIAALDEPDPFTRSATFTALNRIGLATPSAWPVVVAGLAHSQAIIREGVRLAVRETYDERLVAVLAALAREPSRSPEARIAALGLLAGVARRQPAWKRPRAPVGARAGPVPLTTRDVSSRAHVRW